MTDPERISQRSSGLAAELLRAGAEEQPESAGIERTLAALGVAGVALGATSTASAAATGASAGAKVGAVGGGAAAGGAVKATTGLLLVKWVGIGVLGGASLAGAAAVVAPRMAGPAATAPSNSAQAPRAATKPASPKRDGARDRGSEAVTPAAPEVDVPTASTGEAPAAAAPPVAAVGSSGASVALAPNGANVVGAAGRELGPDSTPEIEIGAPLAAEVALVDRARALLASGQTEQGLSLLADYERDFKAPRLLPEVLFLRLETYQRAGRDAEARQVARRLLEGFPKSPHAARARKVLGLQ